MRTLLRALAAAIALLAVSLSPALAQRLYGADGAGGNPATNLYILSPSTGGIVSTVGPIGFAVTGLAFGPGNVLYGVTGNASPVSPRSLIRINPTTGAGTLVGALGTTVNDITYLDGMMFGWALANQLVSINLATGAATPVGPPIVGGNFGNGLAAFGGELFLAGAGNTGAFNQINPATGAATLVATLTGGPANGNPISALAFDQNGVLFGSTIAFGGGANPFLITINTATGVVTTRGPSVVALDAIAFAPDPTLATVPTLSQWALIVLALLLPLSLLVVRKRRQA